MVLGIQLLGVSIRNISFTTHFNWHVASYGGPAKLATRLHAAAEQWDAIEELDFLNDWWVINLIIQIGSLIVYRTYKLGEEGLILVFRVCRSQLINFHSTHAVRSSTTLQVFPIIEDFTMLNSACS